MIDRNSLSKIGIGTWGIGGFQARDVRNDDKKQIEALSYSFTKGINYIVCNMFYAEGYAVKLVSKAVQVSGVKRKDIFITLTLSPRSVQSIQACKEELKKFSKISGFEYIDSIQIPMISIVRIGFNKMVDFIHTLLKEKRARYVNIVNSNLEYLKKWHNEFQDKLFAHEVGFNFEVRDNEEFGNMKYAIDYDILNVIFQPLRRNKIAQKNYDLLVSLAKKYRKTQNQIMLNWISSKGYLPIIKSDSIAHIDENLGAFDFKIDPDDIRKIDEFRVPGYKTPEIDWKGTGDGILVDQLHNVFDEVVSKTDT